MKKITAMIAAVLMLTAALTACGNDDKTTPDTAVKETVAATEDTRSAAATKVLEKTEEGGTVEEDAEGNVLEINKDGTITSIKDKNGKAVSLAEYVTTHYIVTSGGIVIGTKQGGSGASSVSPKEDDSDSEADGTSEVSSKPEVKPVETTAPATEKEQAAPEEHEELPTVIVVIPEEQDEYELPIL